MKRNVLKTISSFVLAACTVTMFVSATSNIDREVGITNQENPSFAVEDIFKIALRNIEAAESTALDIAQPLYNFADNQVAWMFYLQPQGYVISDDRGNVLEYNLDGDHRFFNDCEEHYYYGGIASYIIKDGTEYIDLITNNTILDERYVASESNLELDYTSDVFWREDPEERTADVAAAQYNLKKSTRMYNCNNTSNFDYFGTPNTKGVCGSTALGIMTAYLDDYHTDATHNWCVDTKKTADSSSSTQYGRQLVKEIIEYVEPKTGDAFILGGYTYYLQAHNIWDRQLVVALTVNGSWSKAKTQIQRDYPCVLGVANGFVGEYHSSYPDHWVTVVSVSNTSSDVKYYHVNCGWGSAKEDTNKGYDKLNANGANIGRVYYLEDC